MSGNVGDGAPLEWIEPFDLEIQYFLRKHRPHHLFFKGHQFHKDALEFLRIQGKKRDSLWHEDTYSARSVIDPAHFEYAQRRYDGQEPQVNAIWPHSRRLRLMFIEACRMKVNIREDLEPIFKLVDYYVGYTGRDVRNLADSPLQINCGPKDEVKEEGGWVLPLDLARYGVLQEPGHMRLEGIDYYRIDPPMDIDDKRPPKFITEAPGLQVMSPTIDRRSRMDEIWEANNDEMERQLVRLVQIDKINDWNEIARQLGLPAGECYERYREACSLTHTTWTEQQDVELLRAVDHYRTTESDRLSHSLRHSIEDCISRYHELAWNRTPRNQGPMFAEHYPTLPTWLTFHPDQAMSYSGDHHIHHNSNHRTQRDEQIPQPRQASDPSSGRNREPLKQSLLKAPQADEFQVDETQQHQSRDRSQGDDDEVVAGSSSARRSDGGNPDPRPRKKPILKLNGPAPQDEQRGNGVVGDETRGQRQGKTEKQAEPSSNDPDTASTGTKGKKRAHADAEGDDDGAEQRPKRARKAAAQTQTVEDGTLRRSKRLQAKNVKK